MPCALASKYVSRLFQRTRYSRLPLQVTIVSIMVVMATAVVSMRGIQKMIMLQELLMLEPWRAGRQRLMLTELLLWR
jgi:hypothetical protein